MREQFCAQFSHTVLQGDRKMLKKNQPPSREHTAGESLEPITRLALKDEVVNQLKQMIDDGVLIAGSRLPERQLCAQLGVSRTPLREAFRVLVSEGVLEVQPHRGVTVKKLRADDIDHMFQVLEVLEALAGELACDAMSDEELEEIERLHDGMIKAFHRRDRRTFFRLNQKIHEGIVQAARNPALSRVYEGLSGQIRRIRYMAGNTDSEWVLAVEEHEKIMKALKARSGKTLQSVLRTHLKHKRERVKNLLSH